MKTNKAAQNQNVSIIFPYPCQIRFISAFSIHLLVYLNGYHLATFCCRSFSNSLTLL
jgi:hypothetical protein